MKVTMNISEKIKNNKKKTLVRVYSNEKLKDSYQYVTIGEWNDFKDNLNSDFYVETICVNSALDLLDTKDLKARIEYGAIIRENVVIEEEAVILMGAVINTGCYVGKKTMIDMGAILGGNAIVKDNCHIGANAVLAGTIEPYCEKSVVIEKDCLIGAGAIILEGIHVGEGSIIGANALVRDDIPPYSVAVGIPAKVIKKNEKEKFLVEDLRKI